MAVTVEDDGLHLVVYVAEVAAARVLPDLEANGQVALVFGRPTDDRACQVKGSFVGARAATDAERAFVQAQWDGLLDSLEQIGIPRADVRARGRRGRASRSGCARTRSSIRRRGPDAGAPLA